MFCWFSIYYIFVNVYLNESRYTLLKFTVFAQEMEALGILDYDDMKQDSNDTFIDSSEESSTAPRYMMSTATQTASLPSRKIKPIKHPGLVLKTPIAYQSDTDPSVIPIQKDGMGTYIHTYLLLFSFLPTLYFCIRPYIEMF